MRSPTWGVAAWAEVTAAAAKAAIGRDDGFMAGLSLSRSSALWLPRASLILRPRARWRNLSLSHAPRHAVRKLDRLCFRDHPSAGRAWRKADRWAHDEVGLRPETDILRFLTLLYAVARVLGEPKCFQRVPGESGAHDRGGNNESQTHHACTPRRFICRRGARASGAGAVAGPHRLRHAAGADGRQRALLRHLCLRRSKDSVRLQLLSHQAWR